MSNPTWIVFEGLDGSGKTTQAKLLNEYLNRRGLKSLYKHVFDSKAGRLLREMFLENAFSNTLEILLLCAARQAFLDEVATEAKDADVIIVDRFFLSILAMQGVENEDVALINFIRSAVCSGIHQSVVFHMNTSPEDCRARLQLKGARDRIEEKGVHFHRTVFDRYVALVRDETDVYQFDGAGDIEGIHRTIVDTAALLLGLTASTSAASSARLST